MTTATISSKFQVVIPQAIRQQMNLKPGEKVQVLQYDNRIEFIPLRPMKTLRGFLGGIDSRVDREADRI